MNLAALRIALAAMLAIFSSPAIAQGQFQDASNPAIVHSGVVEMCLDGNGKAIPKDNAGTNCAGAGGGAVTQGTVPWVMSNGTPSFANTDSSCTVGVAAAACLGANPRLFVMLQNVSTAASIACSWTSITPALNAIGSFMLAPGQVAFWGPTTSGAPNQALNCIASVAASPLYVEQH